MDYNYTYKGEERNAHSCAGVALCPSAGSHQRDLAGSGSSHSCAELNPSWFCVEEETECRKGGKK